MTSHATVVYYTSNRENPAFETKIRARLLAGRGQWQPKLEHGQRVPLIYPSQNYGFFETKTPVINIKTTAGMHRFTTVNKNQSRWGIPELPYWGKAADIRKELFE